MWCRDFKIKTIESGNFKPRLIVDYLKKKLFEDEILCQFLFQHVFLNYLE